MAWLDPMRRRFRGLWTKFAGGGFLTRRLGGRERRYRTLFEAANDAIFIVQGDRFVQCNSKTLEIYGCREDQILGETPYRFSPPVQPDERNSREEAQEKLAAALAGEPQFFEWRHVRYDGTPFDAEVSLNLVELNDGPYVQAIVRDVSERKRSDEALRASQSMLQSVMENVPQGIFWKDCHSTYLGCNPVFAQAAGLKSPRDIVGKTDFDLPWSPDQAASFREYDRRVMENDAPEYHIIERMRQANGKLAWVETNKVPLHDAQGRVIGILGTYEDITERKQAEEALRQSEEKHKRLIETTDTGYVIIDDQGRVIDANQEYVRLTGRGRVEEVVGHRVLEWTSRGDVDRNAAKVQECVERGFVRDLEVDYLTPAGQRIPVEINAAVLRAGDHIEILGLTRDITERKRAEEALREHQQRISAIVESSSDWIWTIDPTGRHTYSNHAVEKILGYSPAEFQGMGLDLVHPDDRRIVDAQWPVWVETRQGWRNLVLRWRARDGSYRHLESTAVPFLGPQGTLLGFHGVDRDITDRKQAEESLLAHQERLRSLASELSLVEERERHRIAMGLHDHACQTLVLSKMRLEQLQESLPSGRLNEIVDICATLDKTVESVREMIFDLSSPTLYKFGLEAALEELLEDKLRVEHGIHCTFRDDGAPKPLAEDVRILLYQSVRELLINAIKHARAHQVTLDIARCNGSIRITVADDGVGFNAEEALATPSRRRGFGLFNIKERMDYIGGALAMESRSGQGSRFTLIARLAATDTAKETHDGDQDPAGG